MTDTHSSRRAAIRVFTLLAAFLLVSVSLPVASGASVVATQLPPAVAAAPTAPSAPLPPSAHRTAGAPAELRAAGVRVSKKVAAAAADTGSISGTVADATGARLGNVVVDVVDVSGDSGAGPVLTAANGTYTVTGLPGTKKYTVCFAARGATGGTSADGYLDECYQHVPWDLPREGADRPAPAAAKPVAVTAGHTTTGINAALVAYGAISGRVTAFAAGAVHGVGNVFVDVFDGSNQVNDSYSVTAADGTYSVGGLLPPTTGYTVCFDASDAHGASWFPADGYVSQCYHNIPYIYPPVGATRVVVVPGRTTAGINGELTAGAAISGRVSAAPAGGGGLSGVTVSVYDSHGAIAQSAVTGADGTYTITQLPASTPGYTVCFDASRAVGGTATTGYVSQCYQNVVWVSNDGYTPVRPPLAGTTPVAVAAGQITTGINAALAPGGGISGTATAATGGAPVYGFTVDVFAPNRVEPIAIGFGQSNGTYKVTGVPPTTTGDTVCFDTVGADNGIYPPVTGFASQCYHNVGWTTGNPPPAGTNPVVIAAGQITPGINAALVSYGGISGRVTSALDGNLNNVTVDVFAGNGSRLGSTKTSGTYQIDHLPVSTTGYIVCFDASTATGGSSAAGYASQCYRNIPWTTGKPTPVGTTPVAISGGRFTTGINAILVANGPPAGTGISGIVSAAADGGRLAGVSVQAAASDGSGGGAVTGANGRYTITGLSASLTYTVCFNADTATGGSSRLGYTSECYLHIPWNGFYPPAGTTPVVVVAGHFTLINAALNSTATITGTVTSAGGGGVRGVWVSATDSRGEIKHAYTGASGSYSIPGLAAASTYLVCFDTSQAGGGSSPAGYADQCYHNVPWSGNGPAAGITPVVVTAGQITTGINATLVSYGGISGTVRGVDGGLASVDVRVFRPDGSQVGSSGQKFLGRYSFTGLPASTVGYTVCFDAGGEGNVIGESQCYKNIPWVPGTPVPAGTTPVVVVAGQLTVINATLIPNGEISGTVSAATVGGRASVKVEVLRANGSLLAFDFTAPTGSYSIKLPASKTGYTVCFDARYATGATPATGYASQCFKNRAWTSGDPPSAGTTPVVVASGQITTDINAILVPDGEISGSVTAATAGGPLAHIKAEVVDASGLRLAFAVTGSNGSYLLTRLPPSTTGYTVCFDAQNATGATPTTGYASQCYQHTPWKGLDYPAPPGTTPVTVATGHITPCIDVALVTAAKTS